MGKYQPLADYLRNLPDESWDARFAEIENVLGFDLPRSAYEYPAWWANQEAGHSQTRGWRDAGWETSNVDLGGKQVRFVRSRKPQLRKPGARGATGRDLWAQAAAVSGIANRAELTEAALLALIQREAARRLAKLGGSMPDAEAPPRRRFF